jgi:MtN3 and saliva related transmembrane protein
MNVYIEIIGYVSAVLTTVAYVPQTWKTIVTRQTKDISLHMYILMTLGICGWGVYGIFINSIPIILANGVSFLLTLSILIMKIIHK